MAGENHATPESGAMCAGQRFKLDIAMFRYLEDDSKLYRGIWKSTPRSSFTFAVAAKSSSSSGILFAA